MNNAGRGFITLAEIKKPHRIRVVSSGNGKPIPPKIRREKSPRYGKCSTMGEIFKRNKDALKQ